MKAGIFGVLVLVCLPACAPSVTEQAKQLGTRPFSQKVWAQANKLDRAGMVWSFLSQHDVKALTPDQVRDLLGPSTCYSGYDEDPTYCVGPDTVDNGWGKGYMVVFIRDRKAAGQIAEVAIIPAP